MLGIRWMRAVGLICVGLGILAGSRMAAAQGPKAVLAEMAHDFGHVVEGAVVRHDFVIRNDGPAELVIAEVKGG